MNYKSEKSLRIMASWTLAKLFITEEAEGDNRFYQSNEVKELTNLLKEFMIAQSLCQELRINIISSLEKVILEMSDLALDNDFRHKIPFDKEVLIVIRACHKCLKKSPPENWERHDLSCRDFDRICRIREDLNPFSKFIIDNLFKE